ncbi:phosphotransferase [Vibrio cholerae]|nr:phosphotransferase [Vibrio cholerae]
MARGLRPGARAQTGQDAGARRGPGVRRRADRTRRRSHARRRADRRRHEAAPHPPPLRRIGAPDVPSRRGAQLQPAPPGGVPARERVRSPRLQGRPGRCHGSGVPRRTCARGVPVLQRVEPHDAPAADGLRYYPWFGSGDLQQASRSHDPDVDRWARAAGAALASLHAQPPQVARPPAHGPLRKLQGLLERNASLLPAERARLTAIHATLVRRLGDSSAPVPVHGDFSADQVLVGPEGVLLADFDRSTTAPPGLDVGAFVAVDLLHNPSSGRPLRERFLAGYEEAGGRIGEGTVLTWTAAHLLDRLNEPFRACSPRWREEMGDRLDLLEGLLQ